ncbi:MAG: ClbS/DfsB family four-helix bundle protein [Oscillospiraceae bacterium]|nr:ClbS/DfsB family four-helix bundle protein [Oscillospiraceae bacterium]
MEEYKDKAALSEAIRKAAEQFISEFNDVDESGKDVRLDEVDRTPEEMIAYQLGWMELIRGWDADELAGKEVVTPAPGYKWNQMGALYQGFYGRCKGKTLDELTEAFNMSVESLIGWLSGFSEEELFSPGGRKWASSTPSNWPIWKWVHINTVAPFKSFRSKIRKWKKLRASA